MYNTVSVYIHEYIIKLSNLTIMINGIADMIVRCCMTPVLYKKNINRKTDISYQVFRKQ